MQVDYSRASRQELIAIIEMQDRWRLANEFDPITGVMNREGILDRRLRAEMSRVGREGRPLGVCLVDVDGYLDVAGRSGQRCGEAVLAEVASRIRSVLRDYDAVGRIGLDGFLVLAPGAGSDDLRILSGRIRRAVAREPVRYDGDRIPVTVSVGEVAYGGGSSPEKLLSALQAALTRDRNGSGTGGGES